MAKSTGRIPKDQPVTPFPAAPERLHQKGDWLWIPLRGEWRDVSDKPEETVRQRFIRHLHDHYGYALGQMDQERRTMHGHRSPRADIVVWATHEAKAASKTPVLVVECKAEKVDIDIRDYYQGESYTRAVGCEFFIAHNARYTAVFRLVPGVPGEFVQINEIPKVRDWGDARRIEEIKNTLRAFNRREFQELLFKCHSILRDVHKMEPGRAFDTISKILFVKMYVERSGLHGTFTTDYLDLRASTRLPTDPLVHDGLFEQTKKHYKADDLFAATDRLEISEETFRRIVKELERFDLSKTGDDIKGLAFERFLGTTFRGELGQFFTPRPIVDFMIDLLDPQEGELICDPAAGSGGFLIRAFEHVRDRIAEEIQADKDRLRAEIEAEAESHDAEKEKARVDEAFAALNRELLPSDDLNQPADTRVGRLAWKCIFGCDAEPRAARTAKMNMIMHGDGHGGIHYHDGLVDINGIFPSRFDFVVTNPPFGANVGNDQKVNGSDETRVPDDDAYRDHCRERYGDAWEQSWRRNREAAGTNILDLFEIGRGKANRATELVFVERCLSLLKPGGRMGIVLPDGNLNNPSLAWLRRWCEGKARILAIVSLPEETFSSAKATVKASLVFLRRFTDVDETAWEASWTKAHADHDKAFDANRSALCAKLGRRIITGDNPAVEKIVDELAILGVVRAEPAWSVGPPPAYPRGIGPTRASGPRWLGKATDAKRAMRLKRDFVTAFDQDTAARSKTLMSDLRAGLRRIDDAHNAALWATVRETFDYPVFVAAPETVGITSTGETGESVSNKLPAILDAYRAFETWVEAGAKPEDPPDFRQPSAA